MTRATPKLDPPFPNFHTIPALPSIPVNSRPYGLLEKFSKVSAVLRELPQDQARGLGLSTKHQKRNLTREICKSGSENPYEITLGPVPRATNVDLLFKNQTHLFNLAKGLITGQNDIPFTTFKSSRPLFLFRYRFSHQGKFCSFISRKFTFCIRLRMRHCPAPDTLATLSINAFVRKPCGRGSFRPSQVLSFS
ncbi:hypothetical protein AVEN_247606-1 [Araneus ventricosus]|uniref:Uncharacterized protein n=1 Tax=Araneus ventricosus TaxID=182803 RepID=A0A4Y2D9P4_ARAVE|nr:hypothetical protein AVEN_247606-1 [Araneus ventricosus]